MGCGSSKSTAVSVRSVRDANQTSPKSAPKQESDGVTPSADEARQPAGNQIVEDVADNPDAAGTEYPSHEDNGSELPPRSPTPNNDTNDASKPVENSVCDTTEDNEGSSGQDDKEQPIKAESITTEGEQLQTSAAEGGVSDTPPNENRSNSTDADQGKEQADLGCEEPPKTSPTPQDNKSQTSTEHLQPNAEDGNNSMDTDKSPDQDREEQVGTKCDDPPRTPSSPQDDKSPTTMEQQQVNAENLEQPEENESDQIPTGVAQREEDSNPPNANDPIYEAGSENGDIDNDKAPPSNPATDNLEHEPADKSSTPTNPVDGEENTASVSAAETEKDDETRVTPPNDQSCNDINLPADAEEPSTKSVEETHTTEDIDHGKVDLGSDLEGPDASGDNLSTIPHATNPVDQQDDILRGNESNVDTIPQDIATDQTDEPKPVENSHEEPPLVLEPELALKSQAIAETPSEQSNNDQPPAASTTDSTKPRLGMHISAMRKFLADHPEVQSEDLTTSQTNRAVVKPETTGTNQPYIELYNGMTDELGKPLVAPATVFVSHAWKYNFPSTVVDVMEQHALKEPDAYFWFDLFTNDQNAVASKDFDWFSTTFRNSITDIGQVLLVLSPWNEPMPVRRAWCLFEIYNALTEEVNLLINFPQRESESMLKSATANVESLVQALDRIKAENAEATSQEDKQLIFNVIRKSEGGFEQVNTKVKEYLQGWYLGKFGAVFDSLNGSDDFDLLLSLGIFTRDLGLLRKCQLEAKPSANVAEDYQGRVHNAIASVYAEKSDEAMTKLNYDKARELLLQTSKGESHPAIIDSYKGMADLHKKKGELDQALQFYLQALTVLSNIMMAESEQDDGNLSEDKALEKCSEVATSAGHVLRAQGRLDEALQFHKALVARLKTLGENHVDVAVTYDDIAHIYKDKKDIDSALEYYNKSLAVTLETGGEYHEDVAISYANIAMLYNDGGQIDKAEEYLSKSVAVRKHNLDNDVPKVATEEISHNSNQELSKISEEQSHPIPLTVDLNNKEEQEGITAELANSQQLNLEKAAPENLEKAEPEQSADATLTDTTTIERSNDQHAPATMKESQRIGMHISAIRKFLADHPEVQTQDLTTSQTNKAVIKPETLGTDKAYIELYNGLTDESGKPLVAPATVFVSHAWKYNFPSTVVDVMEQHALKEPDAYFWFDLFTNDQNTVASKDFDWFSTTFRNSIKDIGQVLLILSPWNEPIPVRRAWCLFEIYNALTEEVNLSINLPKRETEAMLKSATANSENIIHALVGIKAENAEATSEEDKQLIFDVIQKSEAGFDGVNKKVKEYLREWYGARFEAVFDSPDGSDDFELLLSLGSFAKDLGILRKCLLKAKPGDNLAEDYQGRVHNAMAIAHAEEGDEAKAILFYYKAIDLLAKTSKGEHHPAIMESYKGMADLHKKKGELDQALQFYLQALKVVSVIMTASEPDGGKLSENKTLKEYSSIVTCVANVLREQGLLDEALKFHNKALNTRLKTLGENHVDVAVTYDNIADVYKEKKDIDSALEYYNKSLAVTLETLGEKHDDVAISYDNIAMMYSDEGQNDKALEYYGKSLVIREHNLGNNDPKVATIHHNMADEMSELDQVDEALVSYQKALDIRLSKLGEQHLDTARTYHCMGVVCRDQKNQLPEAIEYLSKSLEIRKGLLDENHEDKAYSYTNLGSAYNENRQPDLALDCFTKALAIRQRILDTNDPDLAEVYTAVGVIQKNLGNFDEAIVNHEKALEIKLEAFGEDDSNVLDTYVDMAEAYCGKKDCDQAIQWYKKSLAIQMNNCGEEHEDVANTYFEMGVTYYMNQRYDESVDYYNKALPMMSKVHGENHNNVGEVYRNLAAVYKLQQKWELCIQSYDECLRIRQQLYGENHPNVALVYKLMGKMYREKGDDEKADEYEAKSTVTQ